MTSQAFYAPFYDIHYVGWFFLIPKEHAAKFSRKEFIKKDGTVLVGPFVDQATAQRRANTTFDALKGVRYENQRTTA